MSAALWACARYLISRVGRAGKISFIFDFFGRFRFAIVAEGTLLTGRPVARFIFIAPGANRKNCANVRR